MLFRVQGHLGRNFFLGAGDLAMRARWDRGAQPKATKTCPERGGRAKGHQDEETRSKSHTAKKNVFQDGGQAPKRFEMPLFSFVAAHVGDALREARS